MTKKAECNAATGQQLRIMTLTKTKLQSYSLVVIDCNITNKLTKKKKKNSARASKSGLTP